MSPFYESDEDTPRGRPVRDFIEIFEDEYDGDHEDEEADPDRTPLVPARKSSLNSVSSLPLSNTGPLGFKSEIPIAPYAAIRFPIDGYDSDEVSTS